MITTREHVIRALDKNVRFDGRKKDEYRPVTVEYGVSANAEGSALVSMGDTKVIAGIKLSLEKPYDDRPDEGMLMVDAQLLPLSNPRFESGPPGIDAIELARVMDRGVRESKCIEMKKLCIEKGEKVWMVSIDVCTINADGNLYDCTSLAILAALKDAKFPELDDNGNINYKKRSKKSLPLVKEPVAVTIWKVKNHHVVDPTEEEQGAFDSRLTITTLKDDTICALQKGEDGTLVINEVADLIDLATAKAAELRKAL